MAVYESLLLNTAVPQIQAAQAGDSYVMVVNATTPALRITQTGTGDSILVEDAANPDSSPFVVTAAGDVGIGTSSPSYKLEVNGGASDAMSLFNSTNANGAHLRFAASGTVKSFIGGAPGFLGSGTADDLGIRAVGSVLFATNGSSVDMTLDSSGNLGLGVTPSTWYSLLKAFDVGSNAAAIYSGGITHNAYFDNTDVRWEYKNSSSSPATFLNIQNGQFAFNIAVAGTAGNDIPFIQAMTLDASGNLIIGDTSGASTLNLVRGGSDSTEIKLKQTGTGGRDYRILSSGSGYGSAGNLIFYDATASSERARIDSSGNLLIGSPTNTTVSNLILNGATRWAVGTQSGGNLFYIVRDSDGVGQYMVNGSTSWTAASDERNKDIIETISDAANKVSTLRAVIGKYKTDEEGTRRSFLIAQDVQKVLPEAVDATNPEKLGVAYTETIPLLVAAIQEQQAMINELKAEVAALKGA
jgi:hypothetical protein